MKYCPECEAVKPKSEFYAHPAKADRLLGICKECHKARMKKNRQDNPLVQARDRERAKQPKVKARISTNAAKWQRDNPERVAARRRKDPAAYKARTAVGNAVRDGRLFRGQCEVCGTTEKVQAHHVDYSKALEVTWLCARHHHDIHPKWHRPCLVDITEEYYDPHPTVGGTGSETERE